MATTQTATATVVGTLPPATFTATVGLPQIALGFPGIPGVGIGKTVTVRATIPAPAPAGGVAVTMTSDAPGIASVPGTPVTIPQGATTADFTVTGVATGTTTLRGNATGYTEGTLSIDVQVRSISVPTTLNVPFGQTASLPINIGAPAPAGGVVIDVVSDNPTAVGIQTRDRDHSGRRPGGQRNGAGAAARHRQRDREQSGLRCRRLGGDHLGVAQHHPGLGFAQRELRHQHRPPLREQRCRHLGAGGRGARSRCPPPIRPAWQPIHLGPSRRAWSRRPLALTYGGTATLPCTTKLLATAPNIQPDSINVTVNSIPQITVSAPTVGSGLQVGASVNLGASNHGGVTVHVQSTRPGDPAGLA